MPRKKKIILPSKIINLGSNNLDFSNINDVDIENKSWIDRYKPKELKDYIGLNDFMSEIKRWHKQFIKKKDNYYEFEPIKYPILILNGPTGVGKTLLAELIFKYYDYVIKEINTSYHLIEKNIEKYFKLPSKCMYELKEHDGNFNLFKTYGLLIDELDNLNITEKTIKKIVNVIFFNNNNVIKKNNSYNVRYPVICTTNSIKNKKISLLLKKSIVINLSNVKCEYLFILMKKIFKCENIPFIQKDLKLFISQNNICDYRDSIYNSYNIYLKLKGLKCSLNKKKQICKSLLLKKKEKKCLKINFRSINEIIEDLLNNYHNYFDDSIMRFIESNYRLSLITLLTNYNYINGIDLNKKFAIMNRFYEIFNFNIYDNYYDNTIIKYISYIIFNVIKEINAISTGNIKLKYHTKYNDMRQDRSYFNNNFNNTFNISEFLNSKKENLDTDFSILKNNNKILDNIIDPDILFIYNNLYNYKNLGFNDTIMKKLMKDLVSK